MRRLLVVLATLVALGAPGAGARAEGWTYATLDPSRYAGNSLAMRLDPQGLRRTAWWTILTGIVVSGDGWADDVLPPMEPQAASGPEPAAAGPASPDATQLLITYSVNLALALDGSPWVARVRHDCFGSCTGTVQVNHRTPSGWTTELLGVSYSRPAIEVGADGRVHVAYASLAHEVRYWVRATDGTWADEPVGNTTDEPSLRLDADGVPHLAWADAGRIWYAVRGNGAWQAEVVDSLERVSPELALTAAGEARVTYSATSSSDTPGLWYAEQGGGGWTRTRIVAGSTWGFQNSLALDPAGDPFIAFNDQNGLDLRSASRKHGAWTVSDVDTAGNTGYWPAVAFDPAGHPLVAYQADATLGVRLATGNVIVSVGDQRPPATFAMRALGGIARRGEALRLEVTSPVATRISLRLLDVAGRTLAMLPARTIPAGVSSLRWNVGALPPGICFVRAVTEGGASGATRVAVVR